jgi:6-pyruvoyl-tetrahydropterin synthase
MYEVGVRGRLRAVHYLRGDFGEESRPHEHAYRLEWECSADGLDANGFAVDIALMEGLLRRIAVELDGATVNDLPFFRDRQASVEGLAEYLHGRLLEGLHHGGPATPGLRGSRLKVWESETAWAAHVT